VKGSEDLSWNVCIVMDLQFCSLCVGTVQYVLLLSCYCLIVICFISFALCYVLINFLCFLIIHFMFVVLYVLLCVLCVLYFCIVLCIVSPHVYSCLFSVCVQLY